MIIIYGEGRILMNFLSNTVNTIFYPGHSLDFSVY
jgi:hypothetical protein